MFGEKIDTVILRSLSHARNIASEEELDALALSPPPFDAEKARRELRKILDRFDGSFPLDSSLRYLDVGCGTGDIAIALALHGARDVTGIDFVPRCVTTARSYATNASLQDRVRFVCGDIHAWTPPHRYDVVLSNEALEHIEDPRAFLRRLTDLVEPDGVVLLAFGPLFHSPLGDHMWDFFKVQIPWRGILFSEKALLRVRRERFRPTDPATRFGEIRGGLNRMRYSEFLQYVRETGWVVEFLRVNPQLRSRAAALLSDLLVRGPLVRDYVAASVYAKLRRDPRVS